jgi:hypothetical protein
MDLSRDRLILDLNLWMGGWVGPRARLDDVKCRKLSCPCQPVSTPIELSRLPRRLGRVPKRNQDSAIAIGWTAEGLEFKSRYRRDLSLLHVIKTHSGDHRVSYPMGTGGRGMKKTNHLQLMPRSRIRGSIHPLPHTPS